MMMVRRHIPNPNAWSTMAMAAAASRSQLVVLPTFVYRHLAFHPAVDVNILVRCTVQFLTKP